MSKGELINDVVRLYFEGGDWKTYLKQLVEEVHNGEIQDKRNVYM